MNLKDVCNEDELITRVFHFHQQPLSLTLMGDEWYIYPREWCERIGLQWQPQSKKFRRSAELGCQQIEVLGKDGKVRLEFYLPLARARQWLESMQPKRLSEYVQERLAQYQYELLDLLGQ
jgi:hypothetical protein